MKHALIVVADCQVECKHAVISNDQSQSHEKKKKLNELKPTECYLKHK